MYRVHQLLAVCLLIIASNTFAHNSTAAFSRQTVQ